MKFIHESERREIAATGGDDTYNFVMPVQDKAYRELTIWIVPTSDRVVGDAPNVLNFSHETFFGPSSQASAVTLTDDEIALAYDPGDTVRIWPANNPTANLHRGTRKPTGFAITTQIINLAAAAMNVTVIWCGLTVDQG